MIVMDVHKFIKYSELLAGKLHPKNEEYSYIQDTDLENSLLKSQLDRRDIVEIMQKLHLLVRLYTIDIHQFNKNKIDYRWYPAANYHFNCSPSQTLKNNTLIIEFQQYLLPSSFMLLLEEVRKMADGKLMFRSIYDAQIEDRSGKFIDLHYQSNEAHVFAILR